MPFENFHSLSDEKHILVELATQSRFLVGVVIAWNEYDEMKPLAMSRHSLSLFGLYFESA